VVWTGLLNTALGALIALGASAFVERRRWLRESEHRAKSDRRAAYIAILDATAAASETLLNIARGHDNDETSSARAGTVLRDSSVLSRRLELTLLADERVLEEVGRVVGLLRTYRDVVAQGLAFEPGLALRRRSSAPAPPSTSSGTG
jgi:hypothetical protein